MNAAALELDPNSTPIVTNTGGQAIFGSRGGSDFNMSPALN